MKRIGFLLLKLSLLVLRLANRAFNKSGDAHRAYNAHAIYKLVHEEMTR